MKSNNFNGWGTKQTGRGRQRRRQRGHGQDGWGRMQWHHRRTWRLCHQQRASRSPSAESLCCTLSIPSSPPSKILPSYLSKVWRRNPNPLKQWWLEKQKQCRKNSDWKNNAEVLSVGFQWYMDLYIEIVMPSFNKAFSGWIFWAFDINTVILFWLLYQLRYLSMHQFRLS